VTGEQQLPHGRCFCGVPCIRKEGEYVGTAAAEGEAENNPMIAAVNRCATQKQPRKDNRPKTTTQNQPPKNNHAKTTAQRQPPKIDHQNQPPKINHPKSSATARVKGSGRGCPLHTRWIGSEKSFWFKERVLPRRLCCGWQFVFDEGVGVLRLRAQDDRAGGT